MPVECRTVIDWMQEWARPEFAEEGDRIGLLVGSPSQRVKKLLVTLEVTDEVIAEASAVGADLVVSHHPLFRDPLTSLRDDLYPASLACKLVKAGIALFAAHTNLDAAPGGVNDILAERLGLIDVELLLSTHEEKLYKVVVFVPEGHEDEVRRAMCSAGAGWIGNYSDCTFQVAGTGTFRPLEGTSPFIGETGRLEKVGELRIETIVPERKLPEVLQRMIAVHPYEEVAYDVYPLKNRGKETGLGRVGRLPERMPLAAFAGHVMKCLELDAVRFVGEPDKTVSRVALCGGSAMVLLQHAVRAGADVYVTGDVRHHGALEALARGIALVDAGHYGTERVVVPAIAGYLEGRAKEAGCDLEVVISRVKTDPFRHL
ncbi:MAG: hypothetical protein PWQ39_982 [Thermacetogenium sp.]|nr:hypothetical protein [Thermacetogenium sp.]